MMYSGDIETLLLDMEHNAHELPAQLHMGRGWYLTVAVRGFVLGYFINNWIPAAILEGARYGWVDRDHVLERMRLAQFAEEPPI